MLSFLLSNTFRKIGGSLALLLIIVYIVYYISNLKKENYKLHTKIKQMEAIFKQCQDEKMIYELYCTTKQDIEATGVEDVKKTDNNGSIFFDFSRL